MRPSSRPLLARSPSFEPRAHSMRLLVGARSGEASDYGCEPAPQYEATGDWHRLSGSLGTLDQLPVRVLSNDEPISELPKVAPTYLKTHAVLTRAGQRPFRRASAAAHEMPGSVSQRLGRSGGPISPFEPRPPISISINLDDQFDHARARVMALGAGGLASSGSNLVGHSAEAGRQPKNDRPEHPKQKPASGQYHP